MSGIIPSFSPSADHPPFPRVAESDQNVSPTVPFGRDLQSPSYINDARQSDTGNDQNLLPTVPFGHTLRSPSFVNNTNNTFSNAMDSTSASPSFNCLKQSSRSQWHILLENICGRHYDHQKHAFAKADVERGLFVCSMEISNDSSVLSDLTQSYRNEPALQNQLYMKCTEISDVYMRITDSQIQKLSEMLVNLLSPIKNPEKRYLLYRNARRLQFLENLRIGDRVTVASLDGESSASAKSNNSRIGTVAWIGILPGRREGTWFGINLDEAVGDMDGYYDGEHLFPSLRNRGVIVTADRLSPPSACQQSARVVPIIKTSPLFPVSPRLPRIRLDALPSKDSVVCSSGTTVSASVVRNIPIQVVNEDLHDSKISPFCIVHPSSAGCVSIPVTHSHTIADGKNPSNRSGSRWQRAADPLNVRHEIKDDSFFNPSLNLLDQNNEMVSDEVDSPILSPPERSSTVFSRVNHNDNKSRSHLDVGERMVWFDEVGLPRKGRICWIGMLPGHRDNYAGIEFDDAIGEGTGKFDGKQIFLARDDHAAFIPLDLCFPECDGSARNEYEMSTYDDNVNQNPSCTEGYYVKINHKNSERYGVVKWIGFLFDRNLRVRRKMAAVEIDGVVPNDWTQAIDGRIVGEDGPAYFHSSGLTVIVPLSTLVADDRFLCRNLPDSLTEPDLAFGPVDSGCEKKPCLPCNRVECLVGQKKGIQGYHNSCYLDAALYAMYVQDCSFDCLLEAKEGESDDIAEVRRVLSTEIVYPLRRFHFVRADHIMKLRKLLDRLLSPQMTGLASEEKDTEEFLNAFFALLSVSPLLCTRLLSDYEKLNHSYLFSLVNEYDAWRADQRNVSNLQVLLDRAFFSANIMLTEVPRTLILQLPRYGHQKLFDKIVPLKDLDITHLLENEPQPCALCEKPADVKCPECFLTKDVLLSDVTFCSDCFRKSHAVNDHQFQRISSPKILDPQTLPLSSPNVSSGTNKCGRHKMQLSAVICIETSHYVSFVRTNSSNDWLFFDSMADRCGFDNGYNIPEVILCSGISSWLSVDGYRRLRSAVAHEGHLPPEVEADRHLNRLLSDGYMCIYSMENGCYGSSMRF